MPTELRLTNRRTREGRRASRGDSEGGGDPATRSDGAGASARGKGLRRGSLEALPRRPRVGPMSGPDAEGASDGDGAARSRSQSVSEDAQIPASELQPMQTFLVGALRAKTRGDSEHYDHVCTQLSQRTESRTLARLYAALERMVPTLVSNPQEYQALVRSMLSYDGRAGGLGVLKRFRSLAIALVGANSTFFIPAVKALCRSLRLDQSELGDESPSSLYKRSARFALAHEGIRHCLALTPSGAEQLGNILEESFPHRYLPGKMLQAYTDQVLQVCSYAPTLQGRLLELLLDKCLEIDVEIKISDSGHVGIEENEDAILDGIFDADGGDAASAKAPHAENVCVSVRGRSLEAAVGEAADKLDGMLELLFDYCLRQLPCAKLTRQLLSAFEKRVLTTHKSKFVQFVLFVCASQSSAFRDALAGLLADVTLDDKRPSVARMAGACYLASFLSRGSNFVDATLLCNCLTRLLDWAHSYATWHASGAPGGTFAKYRANGGSPGAGENLFERSLVGFAALGAPLHPHAVFFSVCQAALYTVCFRAEHVSDAVRRHAAWSCMVSSDLQPLRFCLESVRREFFCVAMEEKMLSTELLQQMLRELPPPEADASAPPSPARGRAAATAEEGEAEEGRRKRMRMRSLTPPGRGAGGGIKRVASGSKIALPSASSFGGASKRLERKRGRKDEGTGGMGKGRNPLDSFFPFDPFLLRRSHRFVEDAYTFWDMTDDEDDEDAEADGDEDAEGAEEGMRAPEHIKSLRSSLSSMRMSHERSESVSSAGSVLSHPSAAFALRHGRSRTSSIASEDGTSAADGHDAFVTHEDIDSNPLGLANLREIALRASMSRRASVASSTGDSF